VARAARWRYRHGVSGRLLTTRQVADRLGLSSAAVLRRWRAGEIPGYRIDTNVLRFDSDELDAWLSARRVGTLVAVPDTTRSRDAG
jgi:excisionase family DNA binding protein